MKLPALFLNFKTYKEATGANAISLARLAESASRSARIPVCLVVQALDIRAVSEAVSLPVYAQHLDPVTYGSNTGSILAEALAEAGAKGTVLNHAENKRDDSFLSKAVERAREAGLELLLCAENAERARKLASFSPELIAYEPPELIGGNVSVSAAKPQLITATVDAVRKASQSTAVLAGAGIKTEEDVRVSLKLGTKGVFVASGIIKAQDQKAALSSLLGGFKGFCQ